MLSIHFCPLLKQKCPNSRGCIDFNNKHTEDIIMDSKIEKMMRVLTGCKIICDFNKELINAVEEVNDISGVMLKSVDDDITTNNALDTVDERLEDMNAIIKQIIERVVDVINSCPMVSMAEVSKGQFNDVHIKNSLDNILNKIGLSKSDLDDLNGNGQA
jgi:hypothetical protein|tara:strand:- start:5019 stop:5495 length:477 start_codon:yes stop_codon:yes gene_type:complete